MQGKKIFRSIEFWKSSMMSMTDNKLSDNSFYELLRSVFGKIKTPFNKQQLLKDLEKFLLREDIQKTIISYISENDAKIIAAVALFDEPFPEDLKNFFADEFNYMQFHDIIVNLEERFILYRYKDEEARAGHQTKLALNPVLEQALAPFTSDISLLFPSSLSTPKTKRGKPLTVLNDRVLAGLLSFVSQWTETAFFKREDILRKQIIDAGKNCFPNLVLEEVLGALQVLGLFYVQDDKLLPDKKRFSDIALLLPRERMEYCVAALIVYKEANNPLNIQAPYYKNRLKEAVSFIHSFLDFLALVNNNTEKTLARLALILKSRMNSYINIDFFIEALAKTNLLTLNCASHSEHSASKSISIDSGSSVFVYPEVVFTDAIELASFLNIKETSAVVRFELEKDSAVRAFNSGTSAQQIIDTLNRLSDKKIPENIEWNLKDWEKRHGEVSLKKGVVLTLAKDKQYLAKTMPLSTLINETLAPGVYLLNETTEEEATSALNSAGIDIIAQNKKREAVFYQNALAQNYFPMPTGIAINHNMSYLTGSHVLTDMPASAQIANFHAILEKMPLDKVGKDELSARIDRRLILCESQLKEANIRYEKLEARHMDYTGKQNIAKQAVAQNSLVEVVWQNGKQIFGMASALEKKESGLVLIVIPIGEDEELQIPLAKISLLRRIKKSIFEG